MAVAIKAVADTPHNHHFTEYRDITDEDTQIIEAAVPTYYDARIAASFAYDNEGYDVVDPRGKMGISQIGNESVMLDYSAVDVVDGIGNTNANNNKPQRDQNSSNKMVNVSSNVNSGKPSHYPKPRAILEMGNQKLVEETANSIIVSNGNGAPTIHAQREIQKTLLSTEAFWDYVEMKQLGATKAEWSVTSEWSPDELYFMTATTAPRRQIDTGLTTFIGLEDVPTDFTSREANCKRVEGGGGGNKRSHAGEEEGTHVIFQLSNSPKSKALCKDSRIVPGAAATEIELARKLKEFSLLDQYAIGKFAKSFEMIPKTLADHANGNVKVGIDLEEGACKDG
ncbi:hypothetical protein Lser_V15G36919 [Lactuca serriola]